MSALGQKHCSEDRSAASGLPQHADNRKAGSSFTFGPEPDIYLGITFRLLQLMIWLGRRK
jgi:hypothetical protein